MKIQKHNRDICIADQRKTHLGDTIEFLIEDLQENLMTLTDLSIAMERERVRLDGASDKEDRIEVDEVRVITAFLAVYCRELGALQTRVSEVQDIFHAVLSENGVNPIVPETWCRTKSR